MDDPTDLREAQAAIGKLMTAMSIRRVISVDDEYSQHLDPTDLIPLLAGLGPKASTITEFEGIDFAVESGVWKKQVAERLEELSPERNTEILRTTRRMTDPKAKLDELSGRLLPELFQGVEFHRLSQKEWKEKQREFLVGEGIPKTLVLFDQNFSREPDARQKGVDLIQEALGMCQEPDLLCGLLSHEFAATSEYDGWRSLCVENGLDDSRVVLVAKERLSGELMGFARMIKLTVMNRQCHYMRTLAAELLKSSHEKAAADIDGIDVYTFEEIVFESSLREGVWEPDTLLRLFAIYQRHEARRLARENEDLRKLASHVRMVSGISTKATPEPERHSWKVQRLEMFEDGAYLNPYHIPIDLGDVFAKASGKQFIVLAQPCELMVRSEGHRNHTVHEVVLAEIVTTRPENQGAHGAIPFFNANMGATAWVSFKKVHNVRLGILDLCVYQADGVSMFQYDQTCPEGVVPAWAEHFRVVQREARKVIDLYEQLSAGLPNQELKKRLAAKLTQGSNTGSFYGTIEDRTIRYDLKRVARLGQGRPGALLTQYANFQSRSAFEHDFTSEEHGCKSQSADVRADTEASPETSVLQNRP
jgi:hypothetical protein